MVFSGSNLDIRESELNAFALLFVCLPFTFVSEIVYPVYAAAILH